MTTPARVSPFIAGLEARLRALGTPGHPLSRYQLAELSGVHENTINGWWHSTAPSIKSLAKIAPALGMTVADLLAMAGHIERDGHDSDDGLSPFIQVVKERAAGMTDVLEALEAIPQEEWMPALGRILDRAEDEIREVTTLLLRASGTGEQLPNAERRARVAPRPDTRYRQQLARQRRRGGLPNRQYGDLPALENVAVHALRAFDQLAAAA